MTRWSSEFELRSVSEQTNQLQPCGPCEIYNADSVLVSTFEAKRSIDLSSMITANDMITALLEKYS